MNIIHFMYGQQEVVATVVESKTDEIVVERARALHLVPINPQAATIAFIPWFLGDTDGKITIKERDLGPRSIKISKELEGRYLEEVSGIQIASSIKK